MNTAELDKLKNTSSIEIIVHPNSKKKELVKTTKGYELFIKSKPENNKANEECITYLQKILQKEIKLIKGKTIKKKTFIIK